MSHPAKAAKTDREHRRKQGQKPTQQWPWLYGLDDVHHGLLNFANRGIPPRRATLMHSFRNFQRKYFNQPC
jgi:hypothetical protein